jgi:hypothetical protein
MARVMVFNELPTIFQLYRGSQFYSLWEKKSTQIKPQTCSNSLTNFYHITLYRIHLNMRRIRTDNVSGDRR